jgi:MFS family permease
MGDVPPSSIEEVLQRADRDGHFHRGVCAAVCAACMCGGMGGGAAPFLMNPVSSELGFSAWERSLFASALFIGMWAGSFVGGVLCDAYGPGYTMASTLFVLGLAGPAPALLPASDPNPAAAGTGTALVLLFSARCATGLGMVICFQAGNTYVAESCPTRLRTHYMSLLHVGIAMGGFATSGLALCIASSSWRLLLVVNALPTLAAAPLVLHFARQNESPRWLLVAGHHLRCRQVPQHRLVP